MPRADANRRRCAIYTRKSSEEGLEQEFNSLAAQREACEAYIRSQQHEGWLLARTRYGRWRVLGRQSRATRGATPAHRYPGGPNRHRGRVQGRPADPLARRFCPAGRALRHTGCVVRFGDAAIQHDELDGAPDAQRAVVLCPVRARGHRTLVINPAEAETVRRVFALYRELGCVRRVKEEADRLGLRTKCSTTTNGTERGGKPFSRGHLYTLLSNPIYTGHIAHKGALHSGQQAALIDDESWSTVRDQLAANTSNHRRRAKAAEPSLLAGLLVDARGERLTPSHAVKKGRRYRYYVSAALITDAGTDREGWRLVAGEIEEAVIRILADALTSPASLVERFGAAGMPSD